MSETRILNLLIIKILRVLFQCFLSRGPSIPKNHKLAPEKFGFDGNFTTNIQIDWFLLHEIIWLKNVGAIRFGSSSNSCRNMNWSDRPGVGHKRWRLEFSQHNLPAELTFVHSAAHFHTETTRSCSYNIEGHEIPGCWWKPREHSVVRTKWKVLLYLGPGLSQDLYLLLQTWTSIYVSICTLRMTQILSRHSFNFQ